MGRCCGQQTDFKKNEKTKVKGNKKVCRADCIHRNRIGHRTGGAGETRRKWSTAAQVKVREKGECAAGSTPILILA